MSMKEKLQVVSGGSCERLHVYADGFNEAAHGVAWTGRATVFPCSMGMASTWNATLVKRMGQVVAKEALAKHWGDRSNALSFFAPNINIVRDVRWGRAQETYGGDPYLTGTLGVAYVRGMQRFEAGNETLLAVRSVAKHFASYDLESNFAVGGTDGQYRLSYDANVSEADLHQTYLPAFEDLVRDGDLKGVMCAYNSVNGTPLCANSLLKNELRGKMGFQGIVISDCGAIGFMISNHRWNHSSGTPYTLTEAAAASLNAGTDLNCGSAYATSLPAALNKSMIDEKTINTALARNLRGWLELGLFQDSATAAVDPRRRIPMSVVDSPEHRALAKQAAVESAVLLKNDGTLPLAPGGRTKIAVVGPNANRTLTLTSNYAGCKRGAGGPIIPSCTFVNPLQGLTALFSNVTFAQGVDIDTDNVSGIANAVAVARDADVVIFVGGLITCQETGDQCIEAEAKDRSTGASPPRDVGVGLPGKQLELLEALAQETNTSIVAVIMSGSAVALPWASREPRISAIVQHFYAGVLGGEALAEVLAGLHAPSGRLPVMVPESEAQLPKDYLDSSMTAGMGRTHRYFTGTPLYPFGFGMGYSTFEYQKLSLSEGAISTTSEGALSRKFITASVRILNRGEFAKPHMHTVVIFAHNIELTIDRNANVAASVPKQLMVGFTKVWIKPREVVTINVDIPLRNLRLYIGRSFEVMRGSYVLSAGTQNETFRVL